MTASNTNREVPIMSPVRDPKTVNLNAKYFTKTREEATPEMLSHMAEILGYPNQDALVDVMLNGGLLVARWQDLNEGLVAFHMPTSFVPSDDLLKDLSHLIVWYDFEESDYYEWGEPIREGHETHAVFYTQPKYAPLFIYWLSSRDIPFDVTDALDWSETGPEGTQFIPSGYSAWKNRQESGEWDMI